MINNDKPSLNFDDIGENQDDDLGGSSHRYYLILFNKDNSVAVVPYSWLMDIDGSKNCYWPGIRINPNMVKKCIPPKLNWKCYSVTVQERFDSYEDANQALEDFSKNDEVREKYGRGLREPIKKNFSDDEDDEEQEPSQLIPPKNRVQIINNTVLSQKQWTTMLENANIDIIGKVGSNTNEKTSPDIDEGKTDESREKREGDVEKKMEEMFLESSNTKLFQELAHLKCLMQRTLAKVSLIQEKMENHQEKSKPNRTFRFAHMTPLKSLEELQYFENSTRDLDNVKDELKIWFLGIGGVNHKDFITRCLKRLFSNKLGISCSWTGQKSNFQLKNLIIMATMLDACKESFPNSTDKEYEMCVREWFRHCMQRHKRECPQQEDSQ